MATDYGKTELGPRVGEPLSVLAGGQAGAVRKPGGITINWDTVPAVSGSDLTLYDGTLVKVGEKFLRYGQVMTMIDSAAVDTFTLSGDPTGGAFVVGVSVDGAQFLYTDPIAYNAAAADVKAAIEAKIGAGATSVARSGSSPNYAFAVTAAGTLKGHFVAFKVIPALTGGTNATVTLTEPTSNLLYGTFGPAQTNATDGRQTIANGRCYLVDQTVRENDYWNMQSGQASKYLGVLEGGLMWQARMLVSDNGAFAPFTNLPSLAAVQAAMPLVRLRTITI